MANVTVSAVDVTVSSEGYGGKDIPFWKLASIFTDDAGTSFDVSFSEFNESQFKDWYDVDLTGSDFSSYLEAGFDLYNSTHTDKQPIYVNTFLSHTSKTQESGSYYELPTRVSSLFR